MPANKHKRKASAHAQSKTAKNAPQSGLITAKPKTFVRIGMFFVAIGTYLLAFESQNDAMFGFAMLALIAGGGTAIYATMAMPKKNSH